jgi:hypothetical protein
MTQSTIGDSRGGPRRPADPARWLVLLGGLLLLGGCLGGSGSSGFDIVAAENAAIDDALDGGTCVVERGLTICASGAAGTPGSPAATPIPTSTPPTDVPVGTATPSVQPSQTPTATSAPARPAVDIALDPADVAVCASADAAEPCTVRLLFVPMAAPSDTAYRAAVRTREPEGPWRIMPVTGNQFEVAVAPGVVTLQTAILLYYGGDPGPVPAEVGVLSESGADFAFVTPPFAARGAGAVP